MITLYHFFLFDNSFIFALAVVSFLEINTGFRLIYAYILCNFQCTTFSANTEDKIVMTNLLIQASITCWMIS